jgi:transposase
MRMTDFLFDPGEDPMPDPIAAEPPDSAGRGKPRLRVPVRNQVVVRAAALDELLPPDHPARMVWQAVSRLDLSPWLDAIEAVEGTVGRNATDPRLLLALWLYATIDGEGSAREIARLAKEHIVYQWLCGEVTINHHTLSDFRSRGAERFDTLFAELIAGLLAEDLVTLCQVAQDGMRVRASAGKSSFRRRATLQECLVKAREQVEAVKRQADANPQEINRRQQAARERAARRWPTAPSWPRNAISGPKSRANRPKRPAPPPLIRRPER